MITPTIGRRVWFFPNGAEQHMFLNDKITPCDAGIVYVWGDKCVNLDVCDHEGNHWAQSSVPILQDDDAVPAIGVYATWMPYQIGQAKKLGSSA